MKNKFASVEPVTYDRAGRYSKIETNAVGNMINGSPTRLEEQSDSNSNVRFKRLDPQVAVSGLHTLSPQKKEFNVKKAVNFEKHKPQ